MLWSFWDLKWPRCLGFGCLVLRVLTTFKALRGSAAKAGAASLSASTDLKASKYIHI